MTTDIRKAQRLTLGSQTLLSASSAPFRQIARGPALQSGQGVAAMASSLERSGAKGVAPVGGLKVAANPDADPMTHITYLASAELRGRGSPSEGFDAASKYAANLMKAYGLEGVNTGDPSGNPFFQTFDLVGFDIQPQLNIHGHPTLGPKLFQHGFYLDDTTTKDEHDIIRREHGHRLPRNGGFSGNLTLDALKRAGIAASKVQNVVGVVRGTGPQANEFVVLMAHLDHVGARGNTIYFGADDNASGSGTILSTLPQLQELQKAGKLNRSVIVLLTAAEEKGLVGSRYFIKHPLPGVPLSAIKACYNADMLGRWQIDRMSLGGGRKAGFLGDIVMKANESLGERKFAVVNADIDQYESSQDGYNFTQAGIPTVFAFEGLSNPKGGGSLHEDYHQPTDTVDKIVRDNGGDKVRKFRDLTVEVARLVSNATLA